MGGADGRKTAVESGMLDIVLKLLASREPIPVRSHSFTLLLFLEPSGHMFDDT